MRTKHKTESLANYDWQYHCDLDYETYHPCQNGSNCCDNDYCRCGQIDNVQFVKIPSTKEIVDKFYAEETDINKYFIDRILTINKIWDKNNWSVQVCGGYYGQEIGDVSITNGTVIEDEIKSLLTLNSLSKQVEFVLNKEYGYLLEEVKNKRWIEIYVDKNSIIFGQKDHFLRLDKTIVDQYKNYPFIRGICLKKGNKFKVLDGYHRLSAGDGHIKILYCE